MDHFNFRTCDQTSFTEKKSIAQSATLYYIYIYTSCPTELRSAKKNSYTSGLFSARSQQTILPQVLPAEAILQRCR